MSTAKRGRKAYSGPAIALPKAVFRSPEYWSLSHRARSLLLALHLDYNLRNNGSLRLLFNKPANYGFASRDQLALARDELLIAGWIAVTRQGGRHCPSLYALTWLPINACDDDGIKSAPTSHLWRADRAGDRDTVGKKMPETIGRKVTKKQKSCPVRRDTLSRQAGYRLVGDSRQAGQSRRFPSILVSRQAGRSHIRHVCATANNVDHDNETPGTTH